MNIERIYSHNPVNIPASANLMQAAAQMKEHHVGALVVIEPLPNAARAIGIVTDRDLVLRGMARGLPPEAATVADVMTEGLAAIPADTGMHQAVEIMRARGVRRLAVADHEGSLVGIVSLDDIVDALATQLHGIAGVLRSERERESAQSAGRAPERVRVI